MRIPLLSLLVFVAASCSMPPARPAASTVAVTVQGPSFNETAALSRFVIPLGVPGAVTAAELSVHDGATELLFGADGRVAPAGQRLTLTPGQSTRTLFLPGSRTYRFALTARDGRTPANEVAYGHVTQALPKDGSATVAVPLTTLIEQAELVSVPAANAVIIGQELDLKLFVRPPGRSDLRVPTGDYSVTYQVSDGAELIESSDPTEAKLGVRVAAREGATGTLTVTATVTGLTSPAPGATGTVQATFTVPIHTSDDPGKDVSPPTVTLNDPGVPRPGETVTLTGSATDDRGVTRVEVYDGAQLLGTAAVNGTTWSYAWRPEAGMHDVTVVAYDAAGNTGSASAVVTVAAPDFTVSVEDASLSIKPGATASTTVSIQRLHGFTGGVTVEATNLPADVAAEPLVIPGGSTSGTLVLAASPYATGSSAASVTASGGSLSRSATLNVTVDTSALNVVYVSTSGSNANAGTAAAPLASIQAGITQASASGAEVRVAGGTYHESLTLASNVRVVGGFDPQSWVRAPATHETILSGGSVAVLGSGVSNAALDGFTVLSADGSGAGARSSYAVVLRDSTAVSITNNRLRPGVGAGGANGERGANGAAGGPGADGGAGQCDSSPPGAGGAGGLHPAGALLSGGAGGRGGAEGAHSGLAGASGSGSQGGSGGAGGSGGNPGRAGGNGMSGGGGASGGHGSGASAVVTVDVARLTDPFVASAGRSGTHGSHGSGGGGGGGGGGQGGTFVDNGSGNGGGGGGAGGEGGRGATGGGGGGGSFGIVLLSSTNVIIEGNDIITASGGAGGAGATGGTGGAGGRGGLGAKHCTQEIGAGGNGGNGGTGGTGGASGGGAGGPSIGVLEDAASSSTRESNATTAGAGGAGGAGGVGSSAGATGVSSAYLKLP